MSPPPSTDPDFRFLDLRTGDDGTTRVRIGVPADCPWFAGHFPGRPILPAVAQLALVHHVQRTLARTLVTGVERLRLTRPVRPGDVVELAIALPEDEGGTGRYALRGTAEGGGEAAGELLSDGLFTWQSGDPRPVPFAPAPYPEDGDDQDADGQPSLAAALPHAPPARLAGPVLEADDGSILCRGRVPAEHPSAAPSAAVAAHPGDRRVAGRPEAWAGGDPPAGHAGCWMALELAAQAAGLLEAARKRRSGGAVEAPPEAYLVRLRGVRYTHPFLPVEASLLARVRRTGGSGPLSLYDAVVEAERADGGPPEELARASLGTFLPPSAE